MEKIKSGLKWFFNSFIWLFILLFIIDIVTKNVVVANREYIFHQPGSRIDLIPGFLGIGYVVNTDAAFGIGVGSNIANRILYIVLASLASAVIIAVYVKKYSKLNRLYKACMMLILVGAIGNIIDRIFYTSEYLSLKEKVLEVGVVDWIDFYGIWRYVFNIADCGIVIGVFMLIIVLLVEEFRDNKSKKATYQIAQQNHEKAIENESATTEVEENKEEQPSEINEEKTEE